MLFRNAVIRTLTGVSVIALGIISTPIMIRILGDSTYGFWMLIMSIEGLTGFLDFGLAVALSRTLASVSGSSGKKINCGTISSSFTIHLGCASIKLFIYILIYIWAETILGIEEAYLQPARAILLILGISSFFNFTMRTFEGIIMSVGRHYIISIIELINNFARLGGLFLILYIGGGVIYIASLHVALILFTWITSYICASHLAAPCNILRPGWNIGEVKQLSKFCRDFSLSMMGTTVRNMMPFTILGRMSGLVPVAQYGVGNRLITMGRRLSVQIFEPAMVRFASLAANGDYDGAKKLFYWTSLHAGLTGGYLGLGIFLLSRPFIYLWVGPKFEVAAQVTQIMAPAIALLIAVHPCSLVLQSLAKHLVTGVVDICEAIIVVLALILGAYQYGALGAAYVFSGALFLIRPWVFIRHACKNLGMPYFKLVKLAYVRPLLTTVIVLVVFSWLKSFFNTIDTWIQFLAIGTTYTLLFALVSVLVGMNREMRGFWFKKLSGYWKKFVVHRV
jgi:O-antigen/teichoic acid export membrane protein